MTQWLKLAFRNILRNKRRSLVTVLAIGVGFAAISVYHGYIYDAYEGLRAMAIRGEGLGHLRINKAGWKEKGKLEPEKYMFSREEADAIMRLLKNEKDVILATPQIQVTGLVSNGSVSTVFIAQGVVPHDEKVIRGRWTEFLPIQGEALNDEVLYGVEMASDLARYLSLKEGSEGVVMAPTLTGQMNALDIVVRGVYNTGNDFSNDKFIRLNFYYAQSLLDTQSVERVVVLLDDWKKTETMRQRLLKKLQDAGIACEIRTWDELSLGFAKMKSYLDTVFLFIFTIVLVIVVMTTVNTMGMAIVERTREIGTLRALGMKRRGVTLLFAWEGALLGVGGSLVGTGVHIIAWTVIKLYPPHYTPPGFSVPVPMMVAMLPGMLLVLSLCFILLSAVAAVIPARRAAKQNIVNALGHT